MGDFLPHLPPVRDQWSVPGEGKQLNACACCSRAGEQLPLLPSLCAALLKKLLVQRWGYADVGHDQRGLCCWSGLHRCHRATLHLGKTHMYQQGPGSWVFSFLLCLCWRGLMVAGGTFWCWSAQPCELGAVRGENRLPGSAQRKRYTTSHGNVSAHIYCCSLFPCSGSEQRSLLHIDYGFGIL